ncbi:probable Sn1-specific diacylglycerol lipase alpha at N-terminal half [Coccomyxa sp. Obi]|nr:probable Sn1-specific diacylglycerol lipase alpha at N-terminal half [Coccomyxa sp. Obi]
MRPSILLTSTPVLGDKVSTGAGAFQNAHKAPNNWLEALFFFAEALRFMYGETLGKWRTADLLIGLAYLAQKGTEEHPASDISERGEVLGLGLPPAERQRLVEELRAVQRYMRYCRALRERQAFAQAAVLRGMGVEPVDILAQVPMARMLKPSYAIVRDRQLKTIVLAIRGTHSLKDMFTSLTGASKPHHIVDGAGVVLGYAHFGMLAGARWLLQETIQPLRDALADNPGYRCKIVGHSLGGGTAAMLTMMLRDTAPDFADATCYAIACPACMTVELARSCSGYVTTIINSTDIVPTISRGAADALREDVVRSAWYEAFRADMRSNVIVRAVESSITGVGSATVWTTSRLATASQRFMSCYQRRSPGKKRSSEAAEGPPHAETASSSTSAGIAVENNVVDVEVARNWIPQDLQSTDGDGWAQALSSLRPITGTATPVSPKANQTWSQRLTAGFRASSHNLYRRASDALSRTMHSSSSSTSVDAVGQQPFDSNSSLEYAANYAVTMVQPPTQEIDMEASSGSFSEEEGTRRSQLPSEQELLEGMQAVQAAVAAAEQEDGILGSPRPVLRHQGRPANSGVFTGVAGQDTAFGMEAPDWDSAQAEHSEEQWKRMTYPAGRILHLVPARLVRDRLPDDAFREPAASECAGKEDTPVHIVPKAQAGNMQGSVRQRAGFQHESKSWQPTNSTFEQQTLHTSMAGVDGSLVMVGEAITTDGEEVEMPQKKEMFVLLDNVPQEAYSRVKLCSTMVADHFIPAYLASMDAVIEGLEVL